MKHVLHFIAFMILVPPLFSQEYRSFDGTGNNIIHEEWGAVGENQLWVVPPAFSDEISEPAGQDRPNPREISNRIFHQEGLIPDAMGLSDYAWVWGQFIDHDITLVPELEDETLHIQVPAGDVYFDPAGTGEVIIPMKRSLYDPETGTSAENPRAFPNMISAFIDASAVYGSDIERAKWLRTFEGGKLKTSEGNLLPFNTLTGEYGDAIDPDAPEMAMPFPFVDTWYVAGDVRANENPLLTSTHILFMREHNRLCDVLAVEHPMWTGEELYHHARRLVGAYMQAIVYEEWLPTMNVHLEPYSGYKHGVNPGIMNVFSAAAYRYGHTVINSTLIRMDNAGEIIPQGNILLRDAFFNTEVIREMGSIDPFFIGMATQIEQDFDCKMIDDLRNFLFGPPGAGGLDLASININRGRERGLSDYNTVRETFGLPAIPDFGSMTSNVWFNQILEETYGDINNIDPWVGVLAEDHMSNTLFGETVMKIMTVQFTALRDGDRFYYEMDDALTPEEKADVKQTRFRDILMRNTDVHFMQENVFVAEEHLVAVVEPKLKDLDVHVYPNPTTDVLHLSANLDAPQDVTVQVLDLIGNVIQQEYIRLDQYSIFEIDLGDYSDGLYLVSIVGADSAGQKFIAKSGS